MKLFNRFKILVVIALICMLFSSCKNDSEKATKVSKFVDSVGTSHTVKKLNLDGRSREISHNENLTVEHKRIDDISLYEICPKNGSEKLVLFLHNSAASKEEFISEMDRYALDGYCCVAMDIKGFGERKSSNKEMLIQIDVETVSDIDLLLDYYSITKNIKHFAIEGFSLGGSIAYQYVADGKTKIDALAVCSSSPNLSEQPDFAIKNGEICKGDWSEKEIENYSKEHNPLRKIDRFNDQAVMVGHSIGDPLIPVRGDQELEKYLYKQKNNKSVFKYFENDTHDVPEEYVRTILPYFNKYVGH